MKSEVKTPVMIGVLVVVVGGIVFFLMKNLSGVGSLDHGQISYTPGVPPWEEKDPAKKAQFAKMPGELHNYSQEQERATHGPRSPETGGK